MDNIKKIEQKYGYVPEEFRAKELLGPLFGKYYLQFVKMVTSGEERVALLNDLNNQLLIVKGDVEVKNQVRDGWFSDIQDRYQENSPS